MKKFGQKFLSFALLVWLPVFGPAAVSAKWFSSFEETSVSIAVENRLASMSLEQKVGQLFIFGFGGKDFSPRVNEMIRTLKPGGIIVFSRNISTARQTAELNRALQAASLKHSGVPLLIALDQEGGDVTRIRMNPPLPSALALGQTHDETLAERMGYLVGNLLSSLGFNMNLAPVLDLSDPEDSTFIGTRSFGENPQIVSRMTSAYGVGLNAAGVIPTGKHFPGHGNLISDSHKDLPAKHHSLAQLMTSDLQPFSLFMKNVRAPAIMVAHVSFPLIDPTRTPATFSKPILSGILREQLKYQGLVVTDDIEMAAAAGVGNFEERAVRAIEAGADLVMVAWSASAQRKAVESVTKAVRDGRLSEEAVTAAVRRVLTTKYKYSSPDRSPGPDLNQFRSVVKSNYLRELSDLILDKNFYQSLNGLPEKSFVWTNRPVLMVSTDEEFAKSFRRSSSLKGLWLPYRLNDAHLERTLRSHPHSHAIVYSTGTRTANFANRLPEDLKKRVLVVNATTPGSIRSPRDFLGVLNIYSRHPNAGKLVAENIIRPLPRLRAPAGAKVSRNILKSER